MIGIHLEYIDEEIMERVAEVEKQQRPYPSDADGVRYSDIIDHYVRSEEFDAPPMVMISDRLDHLSEDGYLRQLRPDPSPVSATYRLTHRGWRMVKSSPPD
ncbi:hypothetical protein [Halobellus sp. H-GB7]|uniref:hypothetical protein n=1 Tax=Halobellus sp. H-GB7 TaxID=3069756 RepID=UPI0027B2DDA2|nr:hypothetical protein [Halobellus sp. H-GB7]MDQ2053186.1 hypothetical protein [Halobellus sp. H-GB7]